MGRPTTYTMVAPTCPVTSTINDILNNEKKSFVKQSDGPMSLGKTVDGRISGIVPKNTPGKYLKERENLESNQTRRSSVSHRRSSASSRRSSISSRSAHSASDSYGPELSILMLPLEPNHVSEAQDRTQMPDALSNREVDDAGGRTEEMDEVHSAVVQNMGTESALAPTACEQHKTSRGRRKGSSRRKVVLQNGRGGAFVKNPNKPQRRLLEMPNVVTLGITTSR